MTYVPLTSRDEKILKSLHKRQELRAQSREEVAVKPEEAPQIPVNGLTALLLAKRKNEQKAVGGVNAKQTKSKTMDAKRPRFLGGIRLLNDGKRASPVKSEIHLHRAVTLPDLQNSAAKKKKKEPPSAGKSGRKLWPGDPTAIGSVRRARYSAFNLLLFVVT